MASAMSEKIIEIEAFRKFHGYHKRGGDSYELLMNTVNTTPFEGTISQE